MHKYILKRILLSIVIIFFVTLIPLVTIAGGSPPGLFSGALITEATLSFLGLGVKFPFASWGNIISIPLVMLTGIGGILAIQRGLLHLPLLLNHITSLILYAGEHDLHVIRRSVFV